MIEKIVAATSGETEPVPLLLLPGTLCDARVFAPLLGCLPARATEVRVLEGETDVASMAKRILAEAPPRFALLGFSLGGIVALEMASLAPNRILGLALMASNAREVRPEVHADRRREAMAGAANLDRYIREEMWPRYVGPGHFENRQLQSLIAAMAVEGGAQLLVDQTEIGLSRIDSRDRIRRMRMPSLVLAGSEDKLCTPEMQQEIAERLPAAELVILLGAGHFVALEEPSAVARHVDKWLHVVDQIATTSAQVEETELGRLEAKEDVRSPPS